MKRLPDLVLLREPIERIGLDSVADDVTVHFPWGSLLRGALAWDDVAYGAIYRLARSWWNADAAALHYRSGRPRAW